MSRNSPAVQSKVQQLRVHVQQLSCCQARCAPPWLHVGRVLNGRLYGSTFGVSLPAVWAQT